MLGSYSTTIFSALMLAVSLVGCNYSVVKKPPADVGQSNFGSETLISADLVQKSILGVCIRCHGGSTLPNLSSIDSIRVEIGRIANEVSTNAMPPPDAGYGPLSDCAKAILQEWIQEGMPAQSTKKVSTVSACQQTGVGTPAPAVPILSMPLNYATFTSEILQPRCLHCHNSNSSDPDAKSILLYPFTELASHKAVLGVDANHSKLYKLISRTDDERMPPPEDSEPLAPDQQEFVRRWLEAGHPEL